MSQMFKLYPLFLLVSFLTPVYSEESNPIADPAAVIISEHVRFTVLTPGVIRMEWSEDSIFEDHASLVFINRKLPVPLFKTATKRGWLQIETEKALVTYKIGSGRFTDQNLKITFTMAGKETSWHPGLVNSGNLLGTARTLDEYDGNLHHRTKQVIDLGQGLISRDGWVFIDDSDRPVFDNFEWQWVMPRPNKEQQDFYFFCYGYDYRAVLKDFIKIAGKIALPPRFAFGAWWSRYWEYTDWELRELINEFEIQNVPLDVLVVDMDWHVTTKNEWYQEGKKIKDQAGEYAGWTGFTWNRSYFPSPADFLKWTESKGLKVCLNLHPASGIQPHEEQYEAMAQAMGIDPQTKKYVPFDIVNKNFAENFLKLVLHPMEKDGVDFWWLDWQQWSTTKIPGVNPTFYLNYVFFSDMERRNEKRPLIFHRYGGLGNHRYQIGFSGDATVSWRSLDFQPYFTANAANVGFGFWSHDIGGHMKGESTPELYTRWVQFGVFSPILRTHCTKDPKIERRIWAYPLDYFYAMRDAWMLRYALIPYIYTAAREAYDTGISICRSMYYDYPRDENAYQFKNQYLFGNAMLVAPITQPMGQDSLFIRREVWLPPGEWIEWFTGTILKGGSIIERAFMLDEIPVYVKSGAIIPMQPPMNHTDEKPVNPLILTIFPGEKGLTKIYEDEGNTNNYKMETFTFTKVHFQKANDAPVKIIIEPVQGGYPGMLDRRAYTIRLPLTFPPVTVKINGQDLSYQTSTGTNMWNYNGDELCTQIYTPEFSVHVPVEVSIQFPQHPLWLISGKKGQIKKMMTFAKALANSNWDKSKYSNDQVVHTAQTGLRMSLNPGSVPKEVEEFNTNWAEILKEIETAVNENKALTATWELLKTETIKIY